MNKGLDFELFDNKVCGNIEDYRITTADLLWNMVLPRMTGFSQITTKLGEVANTGVELVINATPIGVGIFDGDAKRDEA
ncbi:MAG: hypothetical protein WD431_25810 [Cyclobacteriaceae bacterium]